MLGVVNSIHCPGAVDTIFNHSPPLAATSLPKVIVCPLPVGDRVSASKVSPNTVAGASQSSSDSNRHRRFAHTPTLSADSFEFRALRLTSPVNLALIAIESYRIVADRSWRQGRKH